MLLHLSLYTVHNYGRFTSLASCSASIFTNPNEISQQADRNSMKTGATLDEWRVFQVTRVEHQQNVARRCFGVDAALCDERGFTVIRSSSSIRSGSFSSRVCEILSFSNRSFFSHTSRFSLFTKRQLNVTPRVSCRSFSQSGVSSRKNNADSLRQ